MYFNVCVKPTKIFFRKLARIRNPDAKNPKAYIWRHVLLRVIASLSRRSALTALKHPNARVIARFISQTKASVAPTIDK